MKIKIIIIGGFLGSGKTTTILNVGKHLSETGQKVAIIVNEIGEIGIDGDTISSLGIEAKELTSGCICCTLKIDMQFTLSDLAREFKPDIILIEPTGIAFPKQIKDDLAQMDISNIPDMSFAPIVNLVDADRFNTEIKQIPKFIVTQLKDAEIVGINKTDMAGKDRIKEVRATIKNINPEATILEFSARNNDEQFQELLSLLLGDGSENDGKKGEISEKINSIEMSEVSTYSAEFDILSQNLNQDMATTISKNILEEIKNRILNLSLNSDFIGHIKISMDYPDQMLKASLTSSKGSPQIDVFEKKGNLQCKFKFLSAVAKVPEDKLIEIVENSIQGSFTKESIDIKKVESQCNSQQLIDISNLGL